MPSIKSMLDHTLEAWRIAETSPDAPRKWVEMEIDVEDGWEEKSALFGIFRWKEPRYRTVKKGVMMLDTDNYDYHLYHHPHLMENYVIWKKKENNNAK